MSLRNRARKLQKLAGVSYQQALAKLREIGPRASRLHEETGWPMERCDRFLATGQAPIDVVSLVTPSLEEQIREVLEKLLATSQAQSASVMSDRGLFVQAPENEKTRMLARLFKGAPRTRRGLPEGVYENVDKSSLLTVHLERGVLVVRFDARTSLGLVRLRVAHLTDDLDRLLAQEREDEPGSLPPTGTSGSGGAPAEARAVRPTEESERTARRPAPTRRRKKRDPGSAF
jgi:hypothetical protein